MMDRQLITEELLHIQKLVKEVDDILKVSDLDHVAIKDLNDCLSAMKESVITIQLELP